MSDSARDALAGIIERQNEQARRLLGMAPGAALPPRAGVTLPDDPLDRPTEPKAGERP